MVDIEPVRKGYCPDRITTLFVGESAPESGDFFYLGATAMTRHFWRVIDPEAASDLEFLDRFKRRGWYLDDLVLVPVNGMARAEGRANWVQSQPSLSARIAEYPPEAIVVLLLGMREIVEQAARDANSAAKLYAIPFPGMGNQNRFRDAMLKLLPELPSI